MYILERKRYDEMLNLGGFGLEGNFNKTLVQQFGKFGHWYTWFQNFSLMIQAQSSALKLIRNQPNCLGESIGSGVYKLQDWVMVGNNYSLLGCLVHGLSVVA